ncbi:MAG: transcriptional regulator NrdR [Candidatus Bruticola sp.]
MHCPFCDYQDTKVVDSRLSDDGAAVRRRRECVSCQKRFTTYERCEGVPLVVIKQDGRKVNFDRQKLLRGVLMACKKRPIPYERLESLSSRVEQELRNKGFKEVPSRVIGECVMNALRDLDDVAYMRYASICKNFKDINSFSAEIMALKKRENSSL